MPGVGTLGPLIVVVFVLIIVIAFGVTFYRANKIVNSGASDSSLEAELHATLEKAKADAAVPTSSEPNDERMSESIAGAAAKSAGVPDMPMDADPDAALQGQVSEPSATMEARLLELADLHARNLITDEELVTARAKVLAG